MRVRILKAHREFTVGEIVEVSKNVAFGLIDSGKAEITKDIGTPDYKIKALDEEQANGKPTIVRTNHKSRR